MGIRYPFCVLSFKQPVYCGHAVGSQKSYSWKLPMYPCSTTACVLWSCYWPWVSEGLKSGCGLTAAVWGLTERALAQVDCHQSEMSHHIPKRQVYACESLKAL